MSPRERYQQALERGELEPDTAQAEAIEAFQALHEQLLAEREQRSGMRGRLGRALGRSPQPVRGLYCWGGVGTGKTLLFDLFYDALPFDDKLRTHFHRFMSRVHEQLHRLGDIASPLEKIADHFAGRASVVCLDEMHVNDITDAMLMSGLLRALFARGVTLVTTSNTQPDDLYRGGLQREQFLPAIELIKAHTQLVAVHGGTDWRQRNLANASYWIVPHSREADLQLLSTFERAIPINRRRRNWIKVNGRRIELVVWCAGVAWFDFGALCRGARSSDDYLEIARFFHTVLLRRIPVLGEQDDDAARRFINLVDILYDRQVRVFASAEAAPGSLYTGERLADEFQRTHSRLREMQTEDYMTRPHLG